MAKWLVPTLNQCKCFAYYSLLKYLLISSENLFICPLSREEINLSCHDLKCTVFTLILWLLHNFLADFQKFYASLPRILSWVRMHRTFLFSSFFPQESSGKASRVQVPYVHLDAAWQETVGNFCKLWSLLHNNHSLLLYPLQKSSLEERGVRTASRPERAPQPKCMQQVEILGMSSFL